MSIPALDWALDARTKNSGQKLVLIVLANYADEHGEAWPSQETIAAKGCMTSRAVRTHLAELEAQDLISQTHRYKKDGTFDTNAYKLHMDNQRKNLPSEKNDTIQRKIFPGIHQ